MTEDQIERRVSGAIDRLDAQLMGGVLTQSQYDLEVMRVDIWAQRQYDTQTTASRGGR